MTKETNDMKTWLSRYFSKDQLRYADVVSTYNGFSVEMFEQEQLIRTTNCWGHTRQYAEDCAENWVEGIIK